MQLGRGLPISPFLIIYVPSIICFCENHDLNIAFIFGLDATNLCVRPRSVRVICPASWTVWSQRTGTGPHAPRPAHKVRVQSRSMALSMIH